METWLIYSPPIDSFATRIKASQIKLKKFLLRRIFEDAVLASCTDCERKLELSRSRTTLIELTAPITNRRLSSV